MKVHFISIGGSAMHNLAIALKLKGYNVTGSDDKIFEPSSSRLQKYGLMPDKFGWDKSRISNNIDFIILGMHAKIDNPELLEAQKKNIKIYSYPEFIYESSKEKTRIVISGSHGKTSITSIILHVLKKCEIEVDYLVGAQLSGFETMVNLTDQNEFIVIEGDEYLSSAIDDRPKFHVYQPNIALISGISWDHINVFPSEQVYYIQFKKFVETITDGGVLIYNELDKNVKEIVDSTQKSIKKLAYSFPKYNIEDGKTFLNTDEGKLPIEIFGKHNLSNLSGAKLVCQMIGIQEQNFNESLMSFKGADKRLEPILNLSDRIIFKDFAHSPSKVAATTDAIKHQFSDRKLIAVLELHTYSSLNKKFIAQYKNSLKKADLKVLFYDPDVISQKKLDNLDDEFLKLAFNENDLQIFIDSNELKEFLFKQDYRNTNLVFMSSGNFASIDLKELIEEIKIQ